MAEYLVIRIGNDGDEAAHWIAVDASGARRSPPVTGPLGEAVKDVGDRRVIVLVPSAEVLTTTADVPVKGGARLQAALPYALEEFLADDVDNLHFAAGARRASGRIPVSVVSRQKLQRWLQLLDEAGIQPDSLIADSYGLARIPGTISMLVAENQVFVNDGADVELVMQGVSPGDALVAIGALDVGTDDDEGAAPSMPRHVLVYCDAQNDERYQHDWIAIRQELDSLDVKLLPDGAMPRLAVTVASGAGVNLLQGAYAVRRQYSGLFRPWRYAAMLLAGFVATAVLAKAADLMMLKRQESALRVQFQAEYGQIAPGAGDVLDPWGTVASLRERVGSPTGTPQLFLQSMEQLAKAIQANDGARIEAISYRGGVVDVRLRAPNVSMLDNIQRTIDDSGRFNASIQSTDQEGGQVNSRIQIRVAGP